MKVDVRFSESDHNFPVDFSDNGYEAGWQNGYNNGYNDGREDGIEVGKQAEYDKFWDEYQHNGSRTNYSYAFYQWAGDTCKPKYPIKCTASNSARSVFTYAKMTEVLVDIEIKHPTGATYTNQAYMLFTDCRNLVTISKLVLDEKVTFDSTFHNCVALENLTIEGTIGNSLYLNTASKLTHESIMSIINALKDYSGTTTTKTVGFGETNLAKLTDAEKAIATEKGWTLA